MIDPVLVAALLVLAGSAVAVSARRGYVMAVALLVALAAAPLVDSPLPDPPSVAARVLGALLAALVLWGATRVAPVESAGTAIGLAAEVGAAAAAFVAGLRISMVNPLVGPSAAQAAGMAVLVLAVAPLAGRDVLRLGLGGILLALGASLLLTAWVGSPPPLGQLALTALLIGIAGATSVLVARPAATAADEAASREADLAAGPDAAGGSVASSTGPSGMQP
jgi:hypothetical protein